MRLFAPVLAFVDVETTGMDARRDAITEIAIVRVEDRQGDEPCVSTWSTLVDPGMPIPAEIQALTGITNAMVRDAPSFERVAPRVRALVAGALIVAHNARFDYAFLKHAFARFGEQFTARVLCSVKLSRRLFPDAHGHGLDALIARHGLACPERHRACADARLLWEFVQTIYGCRDHTLIDDCVRRVLRTPSLPPHVASDALEHVPEAPGVYLFYGDNALPLYIGKSRDLRRRVSAHFSSDHRSSTDLRLSAEVKRIEYEETAGEIGALLRESRLVKHLMPAHNRALRRKSEAGVLDLRETGAVPRYIRADAIEPASLSGRYGPFSSSRQARQALHAAARAHALCLTTLGLERRDGACFARQLRRCAGSCVGAEKAEEHAARLTSALEPYRIPQWPYRGAAVMYERAQFGTRVDAHVLQDWCWLGTARDESELHQLVEAPPRPEFDVDVARLLVKTVLRSRLPIREAGAHQEPVPAPV
ncbi:MAG: exonuclease domain-containing protein [Pseudomonadota bacterium]|nr:exonuclease domain-containing protein [Pseudomonadota bacterium]